MAGSTRRWRALRRPTLSRSSVSEIAWTIVPRTSPVARSNVSPSRALVGNPDVVLADEPTAALDRDSGSRVVDVLKRLGEKRGTTTVMVTHDNRILDRADRIVTLEDGRIVADAAPGGR